MRKSFIFIFLAFTLLACKKSIKPATTQTATVATNQTTPFVDDTSYPFDTILSGGYHLNYQISVDPKEKDAIQSLRLMRANQLITTISSFTYSGKTNGYEFNALGKKMADFKHHFIFLRIYGKGNPIPFQLIEKSTGNSHLEGYYADHDKANEVILFYVGDENPKFKAYNLKTNRMLTLTTTDKIGCSIPSMCANLETADEKSITVYYNPENGEQKHQYYWEKD